MSATQATLGEFADVDLPRRVNGWDLGDDRPGFRYCPGSPLGSRVYFEGDAEADAVVLVAHTGCDSVSIHRAGWTAGDEPLKRVETTAPIETAISMMRETSPMEVDR